jgi:hypothetical protein
VTKVPVAWRKSCSLQRAFIIGAGKGAFFKMHVARQIEAALVRDIRGTGAGASGNCNRQVKKSANPAELKNSKCSAARSAS